MNEFLTKFKDTSRMTPLRNLEDSANESTIMNFHLKGVKGDDKVKDPIEQYNSEELIPKNQIIPGHIYTFIYKADKPSVYEYNGEKLEFSDKLPVVLVLNNTGNTILGINLNLCSRDIRVIILNLFQNMDTNFFESEAKEMVDKGQPPISKKISKLLAKPDIINYLTGFLTKLANIDYSVIFRTYNVSKIRKIDRLEIWLWEQVPYINYKDSIKQDILLKIWDITGISRIKLN